MRLLTAGSLVRAQLEEPDEQNIEYELYVFRSDVLLFCQNVDLSGFAESLRGIFVLYTKIKII